MSRNDLTRQQLLARNAEIEQRLAEAEETLAAIRAGEVDAIVVDRGGVKQVYTLHGADESYRTIVEQIDEGAITVSGDGTVLYANARFADLVQMPLERVISRNLFQLVGEADADALQALLATEKGAARKTQATLRAADGKEIPVYIVATVVGVEGVKCACLVIDQTPQKRNEELAASEKLARAILDSASEPIVVVDRNRVIIRASGAAHKLAGQNVLFEPVDRAFHTASDGLVKLCERALGGESVRGEPLTTETPDGGTSDVLISAGPLRSEHGAVLGAVVTLTDITQRERAEKLSRALTAVNAAIHSTLDLDTIMQRVVDEAGEALACDTAALFLRKGKSWVVSHTHGVPKGAAGSQMSGDEERHAMLAIRTRKPVAVDDASNDEPANRDRTQESGVCSSLVVPLVIGEEAYGVIFFNYQRIAIAFADYHVDFAAKLAASLSLALENARLFEELQAELAERKGVQEQLEARTRELERSNEDLQRFAYVASHDLQEPLRMIASYTGLLVQQNEGRLDEESQEYVPIILNGVVRMREMIRDLLDFSRLVYEHEQRRVVTDCNVALSFALELLKSNIAETGAAITSDCLASVNANDSALMRVFQNLIGNAIKYCETKPVIHVSASLQGGDWVFAVRDNGIGIEPQHQEKIFGIFKRLHPRGRYSGTGIGLAICKRIIEQHGGRIWVESSPGEGSIFYFTLPAETD